MLNKCPDCGSTEIVLEQKTVFNDKSPLIKLFHKLRRNTRQSGLIRHKERGQLVFTCKACGKSGMIYVD